MNIEKSHFLVRTSTHNTIRAVRVQTTLNLYQSDTEELLSISSADGAQLQSGKKVSLFDLIFMIEWRYQLNMRQKPPFLDDMLSLAALTEDVMFMIELWFHLKTRQKPFLDDMLNLEAMTEDDMFIVELWFQLKMRQEHFLEAMLDLAVWSEDVMFRELREPVNKSDWRAHCFLTVVNAFYRPLENSIRESSTQHEPSLLRII